MQPLRDIERRLMRDAVRHPTALSASDLVVLRYAFALARLGLIRLGKDDIDVFDSVAPFRHWLVEQLEFFVDPERSGSTDFRGVSGLVPTVRSRISGVRVAAQPG